MMILIRIVCFLTSIHCLVGLPLIPEISPTYVLKRDGRKQPVSFDKITKRVRNLCSGLNEKFVDPVVVAQGVVRGLFSGVSTSELDNLASETAAYMSTDHPDYALLASRIAISNLQKDTSRLFSEVIEKLYRYVDPKSGLPAGFISDKLYEKVLKHADEINAYIDHSRDFNFDYFGFKTLEKSYLLKIDNKVVERPQYLFMRVALGIHLEDDDLKAAFETYDLMSEKWFIHASPTLFHAGTKCPQMSSCFLLEMQGDSIEGIYDTLRQCALISKAAGGIGLSVHNIRAKGSYIKGTKGTSNGLVPMLRVFDSTARYVDQGGGKRPGAFAIYLEPWHADIFEVLELRKNTGKEEARARDLFYGLWVPDLFMKRVEEDGEWSLMCPAECPGLADCWGKEFEDLYESYVKRGKARKTIRARELWYAILDAQMETGTPYMLYKDACNRKSNQQNLGTIKCSNLCTEIVEYTAPDEVAVCNLASIVLSKFVRSWNLSARRQRFASTNLGVEAKRLSTLAGSSSSGSGGLVPDNSDTGDEDDEEVPGWKDPIDTSEAKLPPTTTPAAAAVGDNELPPYAELYNVQPRAGYGDQAGVVGAAAAAASPATSAGFLFDHQRLYEVTKVITRNLNKIIDLNYYPIPEARNSNMRHRPIGIGVQGLADAFQCMKLPFDSPDAKRLNRDIFETIYFAALDASCELAEKHGTYESYSGSPVSKGILQHDMWGAKVSDRWDWDALRARIAKHGLRNSLLLAPMPTASTAQILGNNECIEPYTSNMYVRRVRAGEFIVVNPHLLDDLVERGLWTPEIRNHIMANGGSIQNIPEIDSDLKEIYRTVWEIKQRSLIDMAADRGAFIDQSQSLNVFIANPDYSKLTSLHFHSWRRGLKTGMYYLRTKPAAQAIQFTVDHSNKKLSSSSGADGSGSNSSSSSGGSAATPIYGEACTSCSG